MELQWGLLLATLLYISHNHCAAKCLQNLPEVNPKRYMNLEEYNSKRMPIILDVSRRISHQITSYIIKIFLEEELGYPDIIITENNDRFNQSSQIHQRLSATRDEKENPIPPETTLNSEVWISPEGYDSVLWYEEHLIKQCGPIGPSGRFGWFIPKVLLNNRTLVPYWKTFASLDTAKLFTLGDQELESLQIYIKDDKTGYFCKENFCKNGIYTPPQCEGQSCAVLLTGFPDTTGFVVQHVIRLGLFVRVVWVGPHLSQVVSMLTEQLASTTRSMVFLTFTPSAVVPPDDETYITVVFPPCEEFSRDVGCKYDLHTLTKLYSTVFERGAIPAFDAYMKISFNQTEYKDLLLKYRTELRNSHNSTEAVIQVACDWLNQNPGIREHWKSNQDDKSTLYIGGIFPMNPTRSIAYDATSIVLAAEQAQMAVNRNNSLLRDYNLQLLVDDGRCEADAVLKAFIDLILQQKYRKLVGILGPACSNTLEPLAGVSHHYRTIVISYSAEGSSFSDRQKYPYFFRTIGENNQYQQVYLQLFNKLNWKRVASLAEDGQKYTEYLSHLQDLLNSKNFTFVMNRKFPAIRDQHAMRSYLEEMKSRSVRIIIGDVYDSAAREMMCQAYQLQMTAYQSYVWFLPGWLAPNWYDTDHFNQGLDSSEVVPCSTAEMLEAVNGYLSLNHAAWAPNNTIMQTNQTVGEWRENFRTKLQKKTMKSMEVSSYAGYAYDAVWMFALALDQLAKEDPSALSSIHMEHTTKRYVEILGKTDFNGVSGRIQFRGNPSRISVVEVIQWVDRVMRRVGIFEPNMTTSNKDPLAGTLYLNESMIVWLNPEKSKPKDGTVQCFLGLAEYFGVYDCNLFLAIANIIGFCVLGLTLIAGFLFLKNRYDRKVKLTQQYMHSIGLDLLNVGALEKWEIPRDKVVINRKLGEGAFGYVYGGEAYFDTKGWVAVAVKTLKVGSTPEERLEFLCEAEVMKRFEHKNIIQLLGVCTKNEPVYTIMEFMLYGDLKTFLLARRHLVNEKVGEDADEVSSKKLTTMALDVARALSYLAELKFVHRDVASRNCLVNTARVVKLGDFGMTRSMFEKDYYKFSRKGMLPVRWMSPESLSLGLFTPSSDVWSYGVLLYEIITFGSFPFQGMGNNQVLEHVKAGNSLDIPSGVKPQAEALMRSCWTVDYKKRPKASEIVEFIANNPRLLQPCLEGPLASVQIDDSGSVDLLHTERTRKFSFSLRKRNSSGAYNSQVAGGASNSSSCGPPALWVQEEPDPECSNQLFPLGEEDPEWNHPLLHSPEKYLIVNGVPPTSNHYSQYDAPQQDSLL